MWLTGYFAVFFVAGILLARFRRQVSARIRAWPRPLPWLLGLGAVYAMILPSIPRLAPWLPADLLYLLGSAAMIALVVAGGSWNRALESPPLAWLGRVSYSLYLTHNIVLLAVVHLMFGRVGGSTLLVLVVVASLVVASLGFHLVEAPAIRLSRRIADRTRHPAGAPA